ncbi:MAG: alpha/beta fold hydrolase, partial [Nitrososphaerota archaeon]
TPTLSLYGERDAFMSPNTRRAWEAIALRNPNLRIIPVPDAGHLPWLDDPERIVHETKRSLNQVTAPAIVPQTAHPAIERSTPDEQPDTLL